MNIVLTDDEIEQITGYKWASRQLKELHRLGFWRARLSPIGRVLLERAHFEAVSTGPRAEHNRPHVRPPTLRKVA